MGGLQFRGPPFLDPDHAGLEQLQPVEEAQHLSMIAEGEMLVAELVSKRAGLLDAADRQTQPRPLRAVRVAGAW